MLFSYVFLVVCPDCFNSSGPYMFSTFQMVSLCVLPAFRHFLQCLPFDIVSFFLVVFVTAAKSAITYGLFVFVFTTLCSHLASGDFLLSVANLFQDPSTRRTAQSLLPSIRLAD